MQKIFHFFLVLTLKKTISLQNCLHGSWNWTLHQYSCLHAVVHAPINMPMSCENRGEVEGWSRLGFFHRWQTCSVVYTQPSFSTPLKKSSWKGHIFNNLLSNYPFMKFKSSWVLLQTTDRFSYIVRISFGGQARASLHHYSTSLQCHSVTYFTFIKNWRV